MKKRSVISVLMLGCMAFELCACAKKIDEDEFNDSVIDLTEEICDALLGLDCDAIDEVSTHPNRKLRELMPLNDDPDSDDSRVLASKQAVAATIDYEIDEDSLDSDPKEGTASIDVEFTYTDYSDIQDAIDYVSPREFENALDDVDDIKKINITLEFETEEEELKLTNATELDQVYDFDDLNVTYIDSIFDLVDETYLLGAAYNADDESYYNTTTLEMMIVINERGQNLAWTYKYKVCRDWEQIYISDWITEQSPSEIHVVYQSDTVLEPGNYQLLVYEPDNVTIIGFEVDVYAT